MSTVSVLGAAGLSGRLIARELAARGHDVVVCGRDPARVRAAVAPFADRVHDVRRVEVDEPGTLDAALAGCPVAISAIGPYVLLGREVVDAAIRAGTHLTDVSGEQAHVHFVHDQRRDAATRAGIAIVPGAGLTGAVGDLLAAVAGEAAGVAPEVHVTYTTAGGSGLGGAWSSGTRRSVAATLGTTGWSYRDGDLRPAPLGERRRLAWFPRPVGPMHAAAVPGVEAVTVPRHLAGVRSVDTYLAMSTWRAEALQAVGTLARWERVRRPLVRWLDRDLDPPSDARRAATRWACVVEASGSRGVARAWAYGRDPYATAAAVVVDVAASLDALPPGAHPVAAVRAPTTTLDELSARTGLRWSVVRPGQGPAAGTEGNGP